MPNPDSTGQGELDLGVIEFGRPGRRRVEGRFDGGSMTSDAGVMLLLAADRALGLTAAAARCISDPRNPLLITHAVRDMLRQQVYGLALGWEDLNDHKALRQDVAMQTAAGVDREVASAPTLCRLEKWADRATAVRLSDLLVEQFIASFERPPEELVLDFDATDNPLHGQQEERFFHGYYDCYCCLLYMPVATDPAGFARDTSNGTSYAEPHVAGLFALYKSTVPAATITDIGNYLNGVGRTYNVSGMQTPTQVYKTYKGIRFTAL